MKAKRLNHITAMAGILIFSLVLVWQIMAQDTDKRITDPKFQHQGGDRDTATELFGAEEKAQKEAREAASAYQKESLRMLEEIRDLLKKIDENTKPRATLAK